MTKTAVERTVYVTENYKYLVPEDGKLETYGVLLQAAGQKLEEILEKENNL